MSFDDDREEIARERRGGRGGSGDFNDDDDVGTGRWVRSLGREEICPEERLKSIHDAPSYDTGDDWRGK